MKIILTDNNSPEISLSNQEPVIYSLADTALLKDSRPFFVPDFTQRCTRRLSLVVRISRLGKSIAPRFAHRYWDALTVGIPFTAEDMLERCRREGLPWSLCRGFDGAAAIGRFITTEEVGRDFRQFELTLCEDGVETERVSLANLPFGIDDLIAYVSRFYTLRQGDLLFVGTWGEAREARIDTRLSGTLNGRELIAFNVK